MKTNKPKGQHPNEETGVGRPTKYYSEYADIGFELSLVGFIDKGIAKIMGVSKATLNTWKHQHPEFLDSLIRGKAIADGKVALGLYKRATGYEYESEKIMNINGEVVRVPITVHVPPDPGAAMNWLKNRQPEVWREKQTIEHSVDMVVTMDLSGGEKGAPVEDVGFEESDEDE